MLIDITPPIEPGISKVWPGDTPPTQEFLWKIADGATVNLSTLHSSVHLGAHADGPCHYGDGGRASRTSRSTSTSGAAKSCGSRADAENGSESRISRGPRPKPDSSSSTGTFDGFPRVQPGLQRSGARPSWITSTTHGVRLVGTDAPSVDLFDDPKILAHQRFLANDMAIIEGLALDDVAEGRYELIAPPLKLVGFDGSPVRAVLRSLA